MEITDYIKSGMIVLIPALYFIGVILKDSPISDWLIPFLLGGIGVGLSFVWHIGMLGNLGALDVFDSIVQGVLCAAASVYVKNLTLQYQKREEDSNV